MLRNLFGNRKAAAATPTTEGRLVYAIGDIHGRLDLLDPLLSDIVDDLQASGAERPMIVFLGDYVDRGAASAGVVDRVLQLMRIPGIEVRALKGNHEEAYLRFLQDAAFGPTWAEYGGGPTLASYGVAPPMTRTDMEAWTAARDAFELAVPAAHLEFMQKLELMITVGDYVFVHAGLRPGLPLAQQTERDLLWIRQEFLEAPGPFPKIVVHGHTPMEEPQLSRHRLGLDTGAYATNVLTAIRLDDQGQRVMQARGRAPGAQPAA